MKLLLFKAALGASALVAVRTFRRIYTTVISHS